MTGEDVYHGSFNFVPNSVFCCINYEILTVTHKNFPVTSLGSAKTEFKISTWPQNIVKMFVEAAAAVKPAAVPEECVQVVH